jgi:hypothetical protein
MQSSNRSNRVATIFPVLSLLLLVTGFTVSAIGNIRHDIKTLIGSVVYISGGIVGCTYRSHEVRCFILFYIAILSLYLSNVY